VSGDEQGPAPGDIVWLDFSLVEGTEQAGRRPALVISDQQFNTAMGRALVMPITSRVRGWPFETVLPAQSAMQGAVLADQVRVIDWRARRIQIAGAAPAAVLDDARGKLAALAGMT
jgi:mRNA interferase MazF